MPTTITHGIASAALGDYLDEIKATFNIETSERRGTNGTITKIKSFNPTNEFSFKGGGDVALVVGVGAFTITGLTGGVKNLSKYEHTDKNNEFDEFDASGKHYPTATNAS